MAYLPEENVYETGIYQLELTDEVMGGANGISNLQGKQLANRTKYLKSETDRLEEEKVDVSTKGQANGVASLDENGRVPYSLLPSGIIPIGCVIPYMGVTLPFDDWLWCDGSSFDADEYPLLYSVLGMDTVPDLRECALVGAGMNTTHTIASHDVYTVGEFKDDQVQDHRHNYIKDTNGTAYKTADGRVGNGPIGGYTWGLAGNASYDTYVDTMRDGRRGTVTRGKRTGCNFIIKAR